MVFFPASGSMGEVKLLGCSTSVFSCRVEWALKFKGIEYEFVEEDLSNKSEMLLRCNPVYKKIPVLVHNGKPISESLIILEYIDETWKANPLLPEDPYERAVARFWAKFVDEKCLASMRSAVFTEGEEKEKAIESALEALKTLDEEIKGKKFFRGETMGFIDFVAGWIPYWVPVFKEVGGIDLMNAERFPSLHAWSELMLNVSTIKAKVQPRDKVVSSIRAVRESLLDVATNK